MRILGGGLGSLAVTAAQPAFGLAINITAVAKPKFAIDISRPVTPDPEATSWHPGQSRSLMKELIRKRRQELVPGGDRHCAARYGNLHENYASLQS